MRIHPVAGVAALLFVLAAVAVVVRGERNAQALENCRDEILDDYRRRIPEIERQLSDPAIEATTRKRLERQLDSCKHGRTGIPSYFPYNERVSGYVIGAGLAAIGLVCLLYKPKTIKSSTQGYDDTIRPTAYNVGADGSKADDAEDRATESPRRQIVGQLPRKDASNDED